MPPLLAGADARASFGSSASHSIYTRACKQYLKSLGGACGRARRPNGVDDSRNKTSRHFDLAAEFICPFESRRSHHVMSFSIFLEFLVCDMPVTCHNTSVTCCDRSLTGTMSRRVMRQRLERERGADTSFRFHYNIMLPAGARSCVTTPCTTLAVRVRVRVQRQQCTFMR